MNDTNKSNDVSRVTTGVSGLDEVLDGGLIAGHSYLIRGGPGTGKTMLGLHFLKAGVQRGERTLFITLEEPEVQIRRNASTVGFDLADVSFLDLSPTEDFFARVQTYDIFSPSEVDREPTASRIIERVHSLAPHRVVLEGVTQMRYLSPDPYQFRKEVLSFLRFLMAQGVTSLMTSEASQMAPDDDLQFMCDGIIDLEFRDSNRTVLVPKLRGSDFRAGTHAMQLTSHGMAVFPRLIPEEPGRPFTPQIVSSGIAQLDQLLHGGLPRGTVSILTGPSGVGKTTVGMQFMSEAARRGDRTAVYLFEEWEETLIQRCESIQMPVREMIRNCVLKVSHVEPLRYTPDEFAAAVRRDVEERQTRIVMLDSVAGYQLSMRGVDLLARLHALGAYLRNRQVTTLLINDVEPVGGEFTPTELGISPFVDSILFLRYVEAEGELHKAIGILKNRVGDFEKSMRELRLTNDGIKVGAPLRNLRGILAGTPHWAARQVERQ